ncbi:AraC-like DNA-binding protein [Actinoplanes couchii]|uniref:AraC family transcriptional regulator n=1 Tax=Actinoplanes couchii TaxID=403638 RepID=A0ABQ3X1T9_9ACTN|nr:AraC family transcriptional regulator [Actinoplanes couchii]MDR6316879.1 AraC-like DNA-binding protein [Actinoplanes couchii]GID52486.1 AraC family transcriptional regulator [Actinoplanes couchii]
MDTLTGLLDEPRARGAFLLRSVLDPPWCLSIRDEAPLSLVTPVRGTAWITPRDGGPVRIDPGDVAVIRGPDHYTVADDPGTPVQIVIHPGQRCTTIDGADQSEVMDLGVRTWGDSLDSRTVMISGTYQLHSEISTRLLRALPTLLVRPAADGDDTLVTLLGQEMSRTGPAQELVLDRILDLLLISVLRSWLASSDTSVPGWHHAQSDQVVGPALRMLHEEPAHQWTVASLATRAGVSRASLARRFTDLVGEPPMTYLTRWRLTLAADMLRRGDATIGTVARHVGYGSAFALSAAFKRERGVSPQEYRRLADGHPRRPQESPFAPLQPDGQPRVVWLGAPAAPSVPAAPVPVA